MYQSMSQSMRKFRPLSNKVTVVLLILLMTSFGLFAETKTQGQTAGGQCEKPVQFVLF